MKCNNNNKKRTFKSSFVNGGPGDALVLGEFTSLRNKVCKVIRKSLARSAKKLELRADIVEPLAQQKRPPLRSF